MNTGEQPARAKGVGDSGHGLALRPPVCRVSAPAPVKHWVAGEVA